MPANRLGLGMIPIALTLLPMAALGMTYDDIGDFFTGAVNRLGNQPPAQDKPAPFNEPTRNGAIGYSSFGAITESEIIAMQNLRFPQSFHAMRSRFGAPSYMSGNQDWFEAGDGWIIVTYQGTRAVSMEARK